MKKSILSTLIILMMIAFTSTNAEVLPTNLKITVIDELGNLVAGAEVKIYSSKEDYLNSTNPVASQKTSAKGVVKFKKLEPKVYFIEAVSGDKKNDGLGAATEALQEGRTNVVNVVIE